MKVTIVGLGKIGLLLAVQFAGQGHHVVGADIDERVACVRCAPDVRIFLARPTWRGGLAQVVDGGLLEATTPTRPWAVSASEVVGGTFLLYLRRVRRTSSLARARTPRRRLLVWGLRGRARRGTVRGTTGAYRHVCENRLRHPAGGNQRPHRRGRLQPGVQSGARVVGPDSRRTLRGYPKPGSVESTKSSARRGGGLLHRGRWSSSSARILPRGFTGVWDLGWPRRAEMGNGGDHLPRCQHRSGQPVRAVRRPDRRTSPRSCARCNSQPFSHLHNPGIAVGGHCIPVYPWFYLAGDPDATIVRAARAANDAMPERGVELLAKAYGDLADAVVVVLGACYRGGVKETAFSGVFPTVAALRERGARAVVHDPLHNADELTSLGLAPYLEGSKVDAAVVQADHRPYRAFGPADLPGVTVILDGRGILDSEQWPGVQLLAIGRGSIS